MKKLLMIGVGLAIVLSFGMAFAGEQATSSFQTLSNVAVDTTALTAMSGEQLETIEGKVRYNRDLGRYVGRYNRYFGSRTNHNSSSVSQSNNCTFCGNGNGGFNGGNANLGVAQGNQNQTGQSIGGFGFLR